MNPNLYRTVLAVNVLITSAAAQAQNVTNSTPAAVEPSTTTQLITNQTAFPLDYQAPQPSVPVLEMPRMRPSPFAPEPAPVTASTGASTGAPLAGTSQLGGAPPLPTPAAGAPDTPFRWGPFALRPHIAYQVSYGDSLSYSADQRANTWINELSPGILINLGDNWILDYTPTMRWYDDSHFKDATDHRVLLNGAATFRDWSFGLSQGFSKTFQPLIETGSQTEEEIYSTSLNAGRALNDKLSMDLGLSQNFRYIDQAASYQGLTDSLQWSTMDWLDYQYIKELSFGMGAGFTYDDVKVGSDMTSEQLQARAKWVPGNKLSLSASAGLDIRQFLDSDVSDMVSPIFSLSVGYQLFEATSVFVSASSTVSPSYYSDSVSESTGLNAGINQRLLKRLFLNVNGGYTARDYTSTGGVGGSVGNQDTYSVNASLSMAFLKRANISVFYNKSWNDSDAGYYSYDPQTVGAQVGYRF